MAQSEKTEIKGGPDPYTPKPLVVLSRSEWGAEPNPDTLDSGDPRALALPVTDVLHTYTGTDTCQTVDDCKQAMKSLLEESKKNGLGDIPYNFVVGGDGTVFEGRGWLKKPEKNDKFANLHGASVEISHFGVRGGPPTVDQINGSWGLVMKGLQNKYISKELERHADFY